MLHVISAAHEVLSLASGGHHVVLADGTGGSNWNSNPAPTPPPGMKDIFPQWMGWAKYILMVAGFMGLVASGIMMAIGRRNRGHLAAEGASGIVWTIAGLSVGALAGGIVPAIMGA